MALGMVYLLPFLVRQFEAVLLQPHCGVLLAGFAHAGDLGFDVGEKGGNLVSGVDADALDVRAPDASSKRLVADRLVDPQTDGGGIFHDGLLEDGRRHLSNDSRRGWRSGSRLGRETVLGGRAWGRGRASRRSWGLHVKSQLESVARTRNSFGGGQGHSSSDVFQKLLTNSGAAILSLLELVDPVVDRRIQLGESFLLLKQRLLAELDHAWGSKILTDPGVEVASTGPQRMVGTAQVLASFVEVSQFLDRGVSESRRADIDMRQSLPSRGCPHPLSAESRICQPVA